MFRLNTKKRPYFIIGLLVFLYVVVRAITVGITVDEIYTIDWFVPTWVYNAEIKIANNHFLNTFLIKIFCFFDEDSLFLARLPNVLSFLVYLYFAYRIVANYLPKWIGIATFTLLLLNPFLIDFFSLARGYGLSIACMSASLFYAIKYVQTVRLVHFSKSVIWAICSVFAIFSMLYFWVALVLVLNGFTYLQKNRKLIKAVILRSGLYALLLLLLIGHPLWQLIVHKQLYHGGTWNFYQDTIFTLTQYSLFNPYIKKFTYLVSFSLGVLWLVLVFKSFIKRRKEFDPRAIIVIILAVIILEIISGHYLANVLYPIDRNTLFFYPFFILTTAFCIVDLKPKLRYGILCVAVLLALVNFLLLANFYRTILWYSQAHSREIVHQLNREGRQTNTILHVECHWGMIKPLQYYIEKDTLQYIRLQAIPRHESNKKIATNTDYYIHWPVKTGAYQSDGEAMLDMSKYKTEIYKSYPKENVGVYTNIHSKTSQQ